MGAMQAGIAFAAKDLLQLQRESRAWVSFAIAIVSMATFAMLTSSLRRELIGVQLLYLSPAIVVGNFFARCIDTEVRVLAILRMILPSTGAFVRAKLLVMTTFSLAIVWAIVVIDSATILRSGPGLLVARLGITAVATVLHSAVCLGLAACFTRLDERQTSDNAAAPMWVHGGYWLSVGPIVALEWLLEWTAPGSARPDVIGTASPLPFAVSAALLMLLIAIPIGAMLVAGARRLARFE